MKSPNPATGISAAPQTLPQVIKKPQKFIGQFNLHFCWVEHCPRARRSPREGLLKVSLAGEYFPVVSELCGNCKNIEKYCSSTSVFLWMPHWFIPCARWWLSPRSCNTQQDLPPFLDTKGEFYQKAQEKMSTIINPREFQLSRVPGCTLLFGNKKYSRICF